MKAKVGLFCLSSCEGCMVEILNLEDRLLDLLEYIDIVESRILGVHSEEEIDIAFVEGCVMHEEEEKKIQEIRERSKIVVALGDCACSGGKFLFKDFTFREIEIDLPVTGNKLRADPIDKYVKVDYYLRGCPVSNEEFVELVKDLLLQKIFREKTYSVCSECILFEKDCLIDKGYPCLGPITMGGCKAVCPANGKYCYGCRGLYEDANIDGLIRIFKEKGIEVPTYLFDLLKIRKEVRQHE